MCQPHKMVKHTQTIRLFDHFVGLALNPFMHNVVKWHGHTARFLKYVWPFDNILRERVEGLRSKAKFEEDPP